MEKKILTVVVSILIGLLGWLGSLQIQKLTEIEKSIIELKIQVVSIQKEMMTEDRVREIVEYELLKIK